MTGLDAAQNMLTCLDSLDGLFDGLSEDQWTTQSYCPDWDTRGILMHVGGIEEMFRGAEPGSWTDSLPFNEVAAWVSSVADKSSPDLLAAYREVIDARRVELAALTEDQMALPSATPVGPSTYGHFIGIRVFDLWVHEQDIRGPLGMPGHEGGATAEMALDEVHKSMGYIVGKKVGLPDGKSLTARLTGPVEREMHVAVDGRASVVDELADPDVTLTTDSTTFIMLACGRIDPQEQVDAGRITWSGDAEWGERAALNLRYTM